MDISDLPEEHIAAAVALMTADIPFAEKLELDRALSLRDGIPSIVSAQHVRVGDTVRVAGYFGADGDALVEARDEAARTVTIRFKDDGEVLVLAPAWGERGGTLWHLVCTPAR